MESLYIQCVVDREALYKSGNNLNKNQDDQIFSFFIICYDMFLLYFKEYCILYKLTLGTANVTTPFL